MRRRHRDAAACPAELDPRHTEEISSVSAAEDRLLVLGAPETCYVFSDVAELDGRVMQLTEALREAEDGGWGTILDCIPGRLGYYVGERAEQRLILARGTADPRV